MRHKLESLHLEVMGDAVSHWEGDTGSTGSDWEHLFAPSGPAGMDQRQVPGGDRGPGPEDQRQGGEFLTPPPVLLRPGPALTGSVPFRIKLGGSSCC